MTDLNQTDLQKIYDNMLEQKQQALQASMLAKNKQAARQLLERMNRVLIGSSQVSTTTIVTRTEKL